MRRLSGFVLAGAILLLPAFSQGHGAAYAQAASALTFDGDTALWSISIKPDKTADFEQIWESGSVAESGFVDPDPVLVDGKRVRAWFAPGHGEAMATRIAHRVARAKRVVRVSSPVVTSGPILGALAEAVSDGKVDVTSYYAKGKLVRKVPIEELMDTLIYEVELMAKEKEAEGNGEDALPHNNGGWESLSPEAGQSSTLGKEIPVLPRR